MVDPTKGAVLELCGSAAAPPLTRRRPAAAGPRASLLTGTLPPRFSVRDLAAARSLAVKGKNGDVCEE
ncbi:MAG: hypothetical protein ACHQ4F_10805 [Candidatus Dormibacteria bacterium]